MTCRADSELGLRLKRSRATVRPVPDGLLATARAALGRGDVLMAYDAAVSAMEAEPESLEAAFVAALALARAGARERARTSATDLLVRIDDATDVSVRLREDAAALVARLAKQEALATQGDDRPARLRHAADLYEAIADRYGRFYTCINAATLHLLAGDPERARQLAERSRRLVTEARRSDPDDYWLDATEAEAALILGDVEAARRALTRALTVAGDDFATLAVTRRQLRLVCNATSIDPVVLDVLRAPIVLHYCGHRIDPTGVSARFPPDLEAHVDREIRTFLAQHRVGFAYGSLASGADILIAEALLDQGVPLQVVLPFDSAEFERTSVDPAGPGWVDRFRACLGRAESVVHASDSSFMGDDELYGYAGRIAMGHALNRAAFLDAPAQQLAVWDQAEGAILAGTAHDVAVWKASGHPTHVIALPPAEQPPKEARPPAATRELGAILFTDLHGFSRLRDEQFPVFVEQVLGPLGAVLDGHREAVLWCNSWGDAIAAVFSDVIEAAECALGLHEALTRIDLEAIGLPSDLELRIGAHAGPVMAITDPVTHKPTYWGRELTRAARIEPRTPEGQVYVTDAFAALLSLEPVVSFVTEYVGRVTTAKEFETIPMYQLRRRR
jgi:tetratricopeptide (TPR) repeat protein